MCIRKTHFTLIFLKVKMHSKDTRGTDAVHGKDAGNLHWPAGYKAAALSPTCFMSLFSACTHGAGSGFLTCKCPVCTITPETGTSSPCKIFRIKHFPGPLWIRRSTLVQSTGVGGRGGEQSLYINMAPQQCPERGAQCISRLL